MSLEGELQVALRLKQGRVAQVEIQSTRPDIARRLLQGRRRDEVQAAVPRLFSICAASQAAACRLAMAAAAGPPPDEALLAQARAELAEETLRETAWQQLLHLPRWLGTTPTPEALAAARAAPGWRWRGDAGGDAGIDADINPDRGASAGAGFQTEATGTTSARAAAIAQAVFGCAADEWLSLASWPALTHWAAAGTSASARHLQGLLAEHATAADKGEACATPLLPRPTPDWLRALAAAATADPGFAQRPVCQGLPAETGALARLADDPLVGALAPPAPSRLLARHVARLRELALLLAGRHRPGLGALTLAPGSGVAWVDNARGLLVHHVQLDGDVVGVCRIVAPTEWNFHPAGALATALQGLAVADADAARQQAQRLVQSLDPCVHCEIEVAHA